MTGVKGYMSGRPSPIYGIILGVLGVAIGVFGAWFLVTVFRNLGFSFQNNFMGSLWRMMSLTLIAAAFPIAVLVELMWDRWKKRKFHVLSVVVSALMLFEYVLIVSITGLIFEVAFPGLHFTNEPFPGLTGLGLGMMVGLPMLTVAFTIRIPKVRDYVRRAFE